MTVVRRLGFTPSLGSALVMFDEHSVGKLQAAILQTLMDRSEHGHCT